MSPSSPERLAELRRQIVRAAADGIAEQGDTGAEGIAVRLLAEFQDRVEAQARRDALLALRATVEGLPGSWERENAYFRDHHGIDYIDREAVLSAIDHQLGEG